ncbi:magnesium-dependent phosphatase-1 [Spirochaeta cellobiosiphila]|uniref:magnesium-dependent phosphatase-1 n=1 Tax=Spirochaeta cellobiosiphila TaxID=504483 RepID=UPI00048BBD1C|nr:magnesium-dependent phosphatase-1 [Spirochaeta cellobiosiphila]
MLYVFDLDFTLWDCGGTWCDCTSPPYRKTRGGVYDSVGRHIRLYPDVLPILNRLREEGHLLAVASRTHEPMWAKALLKLLDVDTVFQFKEIYPGSKYPHFKSLKEKSHMNYDEMIFFDDEERNIKDIQGLGVKSILVSHGFNWRYLNQVRIHHNSH